MCFFVKWTEKGQSHSDKWSIPRLDLAANFEIFVWIFVGAYDLEAEVFFIIADITEKKISQYMLLSFFYITSHTKLKKKLLKFLIATEVRPNVIMPSI